MAGKSDTYRNNQYRSLRIESLEDRQLLSISPGDLQGIRDVYNDFSIASNVNVIEIEADQLSTSALKNAIDDAKLTTQDDLIVLHTENTNRTISFTNSSDEILLDDPSGRITIIAYGKGSLTINANSYSRIFSIKTGTVQLGNLTLTGGKALTDINGTLSTVGTGGAIVNAGTLTLSNVTVDHNSASNGIFDDNNSNFNSKGGGIYNTGSLFIVDSVVSNNTAYSGPLNTNEVPAYGAGGGIFNNTNATLELRNTTITGNVAESGTKVIQPETTSEDEHPVAVTIELLGSGGGIYNFGATMISTNSVVSNNSAWFGGGISSLFNTKPSNVTITDSQIVNNDADNIGGGLYTAPRCSINIMRTFIQGNTAGLHGGGIANRGSLLLIGSVISGNIADTDGGGIYSWGTYNPSVPVFTVNISNSTITGNTSGNAKAGSGGGIYFSGIQSGKTFAVMAISNSIVVNNRVVLQNNTNDPNDTNIYSKGMCNGSYSLTTFNGWSNDQGNYLYDSTFPLFVSDYNFTTGIEGDYRLFFDSASQAINAGNTIIAETTGLDLTSLDIAGQARVNDGTIDLGAYEYQMTGFDSVFPLRLNVQQGCSFNLRCDGKTDSNGNPISLYLVDLNCDGEFERSGPSIWISWKDLLNRDYDKGYFYLAAKNSLGEASETRLVTVNILEVLPCIYVKETSFYDPRILKFSISAYCYERSIQQWTIDWGDETTPTQYNYLSHSLVSVHYYGDPTETQTCNITLRLVDTNGNGGDRAYYIGSYTVPGSKTNLPKNSVQPTAAAFPGFEATPAPVLEVPLLESERTEVTNCTDSNIQMLYALAFLELDNQPVWSGQLTDMKTNSTIAEQPLQNLSLMIDQPTLSEQRLAVLNFDFLSEDDYELLKPKKVSNIEDTNFQDNEGVFSNMLDYRLRDII